MENLKKTVGVKVSNIADIARLALSTSAPMGPPRAVFRIKNGNKAIISLLVSLPNYYQLRGLPVLFYYQCEDANATCRSSPYISYRIMEGGEQVQFSEKSMPGWAMIPIINVEEIKEIEELSFNERGSS
jgi:hypothetical protein